MKNQAVGIAVTVPSCACGSVRIEEEVGATLGLPRGSLKFVVPTTAQLFYDPTVVELGKVVESLEERGYKVARASVQFRIPPRPAFVPAVWKIRVERLSEALQGVVSASIDFEKSLITVNYLPALVGQREIRAALFDWSGRRLESTKGVRRDETFKARGDNFDPEHIRGDNVHSLYPLGPDVSRPCHDEDLGRIVARV